MSAEKCGCSEKVVAWLDGELSNGEAAYMEQHLAACVECRTKVDAYKKVSVALQSYCDAATTSANTPSRASPCSSLRWRSSGRGSPRIFLAAITHAHGGASCSAAPAIPSVVAVPDAKPASPAPSPRIKPVRVRRSAEPPQSSQTNSPPTESAVQIAIPAEALFPPGAFPQGVAFVADLSIAPDGSPQRLHLEPQLIQFERSR